MSENEAGPRVVVARLAKEYPWVLAALAGGDVHLTGLSKLSSLMQPSNCLELLGRARGKTVREIDGLLAALSPKPDVPELLRALPHRATSTPVESWAAVLEPPKKSSAVERTIPMFDERTLGSPSNGDVSVTTLNPAPTSPSVSASPTSSPDLQLARSGASGTPSNDSATRAPKPTRRREKLRPLSDTRHALQLTIGTDLREKLERARDLMSHRNRSGTFETIVAAAVDLLLAKLERERLGKTKTKRVAKMTMKMSTDAKADVKADVNAELSLPNTSELVASAAATTTDHSRDESEPRQRILSSRAIPRGTRREVFERDGEQCSFVSKAGVRCDARSFLEIDHVHPKALGGGDSASNTRVLCVTHNRLAAEQAFGREHIRRKIREATDRHRARKRPLPRE